MKGIIILVLAGVLVILAALAGGPVLERSRRAGEMEVLRSALDAARISADSCKIALAWQEEEFLQFDRMVDSLRTVVDAFEDAEQGGVPEEDYQEYLEGFDRYNALVGTWRSRADGLQANEARCRALVEAHNHLGDSIKGIQAEWRNEG